MEKKIFQDGFQFSFSSRSLELTLQSIAGETVLIKKWHKTHKAVDFKTYVRSFGNSQVIVSLLKDKAKIPGLGKFNFTELAMAKTIQVAGKKNCYGHRNRFLLYLCTALFRPEGLYCCFKMNCSKHFWITLMNLF